MSCSKNKTRNKYKTPRNKYKTRQKYSRSKHLYRIPRWKGFVYQPDFLSMTDFQSLQHECNRFNTLLDSYKEDFSSVLRYNMPIDSPLVTAMITKYTPLIRMLTNNPRIYLARNVPIEYRKYGAGSFMNMHRDTQLYQIPQYECIFTLSNTTDTYTNVYTPRKQAIHSSPNSLIILRAKGLEHEVTRTTYGERYFLKFIFTETDTLIPSDYRYNVIQR